MDLAALLAASREVSGTPHPAVLGVYPVHDEVDGPAIVENDLEQWMVATPVKPLTLGLVFAGQAEAEGY